MEEANKEKGKNASFMIHRSRRGRDQKKERERQDRCYLLQVMEAYYCPGKVWIHLQFWHSLGDLGAKYFSGLSVEGRTFFQEYELPISKVLSVIALELSFRSTARIGTIYHPKGP